MLKNKFYFITNYLQLFRLRLSFGSSSKSLGAVEFLVPENTQFDILAFLTYRDKKFEGIKVSGERFFAIGSVYSAGGWFSLSRERVAKVVRIRLVYT